MRAGSRPVTAWLHLTRLFLRQFLENDLVSPDADRAQLLAMVGAGLVTLTLFLSMFLSAPYSMMRLTPGQAAMLTLTDKFFYVSLAMLLTALIAAAQWDALSLDHRDAAILDPLPVRPALVRLAKLTAVAMLGATAAVAVNVFPTWVFPWMVSFSLPRMSVVDVFGMMAAHAMVSVTAAVFGYVAILTMREALSALLGPRLFHRVSPALQAVTIVTIGSLLLLLPIASGRIVQRGFSGGWEHLPPMTFVALYEVASRQFLVELPRAGLNERMMRRDPAPTAAYEARRPLFAPMARRIELMFAGLAALLTAAIGINALRAPVGGALLVDTGGRRRRTGEWLARALLVRHPAAQAGFQFALATLFRSKTHRLTLACAAAVGVALMLVVLFRTDLGASQVTVGLLVIQPLLYGSVLTAFRHLIRVPAELRASWGFQLAWRGHPRAFTSGVRRAAMLALALPAILAVMPVVAFVGGPGAAALHALVGLAGAAILLDALMLGYAKAPFACGYVPGAGGKGIVPIFTVAFIIGATLFANLEWAIVTGRYRTDAIVVLAVIFVALRVATYRQPEAVVDFDEGPETFQGLGLHS